MDATPPAIGRRGFLKAATLIALSAFSVDAVSLAAQAPTLPGAPFLPNARRSEHVLERLEALTAREALAQAKDTLALRAASAQPPTTVAGANAAATASADVVRAELIETQRILDAQINSVERTLSHLEANEADLLDETARFGIGVAIFPVDEVRKPFWDDWGRPRSGGRRHVGNDVLAQIGVPLRAIEDGEVETISSGGNGGNGIFYRGVSGSRYFYAHLDEVAELAPGDRLLAGQVVGTVGDTGNAGGAPHLHMQWDPNGGSNWQNPFEMLDVLFGEGRTQAFSEAAAAAVAAETDSSGDGGADGTDAGSGFDREDLSGENSQEIADAIELIFSPDRALGVPRR